MALAAVAVLLSAVGVPASNGGLDHRAAVESAPDPTCSTGIKADGVCCPRSCGSCGGHGCGSLPGGAAACCAGGIIASGRVCSSDPPPCAMSGGGGGWPPPEPTNKTVGVSVSVGQAVIATVSDRFVSYNLDSGWEDRWNLDDPRLLLLAGALGPAHLRVGGTGEDYLVYAIGDFANFSCSHPPKPMTTYRCTLVTEADVSALFQFAERINASVLFGLNDMFGRPTKTKPEVPLCHTECPPQDLSNAAALLTWAAATDVVRNNLYGWELGNELNSVLNGAVGAQTQANDLIALGKLVDSVWPKGGPMPRLVGPDTHSATEYQESGLAWLHTWAETVLKGVSPSRLITTFHMYALGSGQTSGIEASFLNPASLDKVSAGVRAMQAALGPAASAELWAGETAAANNGGKEGVTDTFLDSYWYADQLGQFAKTGVKVFQRQVLLASSGYPLLLCASENATVTPTPDYWVALLFSRLMGTRVLNITVGGAAEAKDLRAYAHCSRDAPSGTVTLLLINLSPDTLSVPTTGLAQPGSQRQEWHLTPGTPLAGLSRLQSKQARLNGVELDLLPGPALPSLVGRAEDGASAVMLAAQSITFVRLQSTSLCA